MMILFFYKKKFVWGNSLGSVGCFKKATQTPNAGHPISYQVAEICEADLRVFQMTGLGEKMPSVPSI
jgi:hypothetical protein